MPVLGSIEFTNVLYTIALTVIIYLIKGTLLRFIHKKTVDKTLYFKIKRIINAISFLIFIVAIAFIWLKAGGSLITFLGLFTAGIALALKDVLLNIAGFLYILIRQPFHIGDRIEIDGIKGDVIDQNLFKFRVIEVGNWVHAEQSTGRIIHIPNSKIFTDSLANYNLGFPYIWDELRVMVTFESNWRRAKEILSEVVKEYAENLESDAHKAIQEASRKYVIFYKSLTPIVYTSVVESGVLLTMRYVVEPKKRRISEEKIWEAVLDRFALAPEVKIAYPTMRRIQE